MKLSYKIQLCCFLVDVVLGIGLIWMILEYLFYGEIQPRIVDDIINVAYVAAILYGYKMGRSHEKEVQKSYKHIENFGTNLPEYCTYNESSNNQKYNNQGGDNYR